MLTCNPTIKVEKCSFVRIRSFIENNINSFYNNEHMDFIKDCFWKNKNRNHFNNSKKNIAVQIRRENEHDRGMAGERASTPNSYYLHVMNVIRNNNVDKELLFHIYSQGNLSQFIDLANEDVVFHLNQDISDTFVGMVAADSLVISPSSFSYVAALLSDGEVYYKPFWHNPKEHWKII